MKMSANETAIEAIKIQLEDLDSDIEIKSAEIKELKTVRRKLASTVRALEKL